MKPGNNKLLFISKITYMTINYTPDKNDLYQRFRYWHVESLLNQAADLLDSCKDELRYFNSLTTSWIEQEISIELQEKEINLERERLEIFERDLITAKSNGELYTNTKPYIDRALEEAKAEYIKVSTDGGAKARAGVSKAERKVNVMENNHQSSLNINKVKWAESDKKYYEERLISKEKNLAKRKELSKDGKALDYDYQRKLVFSRLELLYRDALDRTFMANEGMKLIYGYPDLLVVTSTEEKLDTKVNEIYNWVNKTIAWLVAYGQLDQGFTQSISLMALLNTAERERFYETEDKFEVLITLPESFFLAHDNIRLKGISAALVGTAGTVPWSMICLVPKHAKYKRGDQLFEIDQDNIPPCLLGKIENRNSFRTPETCGMISLNNVSPWGRVESDPSSKWLVKIMRPLETLEKFENVKDVVIEFNLTGKPIP
jgi:hypothetical protein